MKNLALKNAKTRFCELFDFSVLSFNDGGKKLTLLALIVPKILEIIFTKLIGTVNTLMISGYAENAVGATTSATQIITIITTLLNITAHGTTIIVSLELGRGDREQAGRITATAAALAFSISLIISVSMFSFAKPILYLLNLRDDALLFGAQYLKIRGGFMFLTTMSGFFSTMLICNGKAIHTLISGIASNVINVVLCYLFLYKNMIPGVSGTVATAVAAEIAAAVSLVYLVCAFIKCGCPFKICFDKSYISRIYAIGAPGSVASISYSFAMTIAVGFIGSLGIVSLNAYSYINTIIGYTCIGSAAIAGTAPILIGRYAGRADIESVTKVWRISILFAFLSNSLCSLAVLLLHNRILSIFTDNEEIIKVASLVLLIDFVIECFRAIVNVFESSLNACRDVTVTLFAGIVSSWVFIVPLSYVFGIALDMGLAGCWLAFMISECFKGSLYIVRYKRRKWVNKIR